MKFDLPKEEEDDRILDIIRINDDLYYVWANLYQIQINQGRSIEEQFKLKEDLEYKLIEIEEIEGRFSKIEGITVPSLFDISKQLEEVIKLIGPSVHDKEVTRAKNWVDFLNNLFSFTRGCSDELAQVMGNF